MLVRPQTSIPMKYIPITRCKSSASLRRKFQCSSVEPNE